MGKSRQSSTRKSVAYNKTPSLQKEGYEFYESSKKSSKDDDYPENDGYPYVNYKEITNKKEFIKQLQKNKDEGNPREEWRVWTPDEDDLDGVRMFVTDKGSTFGIDKNNNLVSFSSAKNSHGESIENMRAVMEVAKIEGITKFDSFSGNWFFYLHNGYVPVRGETWKHIYDESMMKQGWNPKYDGTEPVFYFEYNPDQAKQMVVDNIDSEEWIANNKDKMT